MSTVSWRSALILSGRMAAAAGQRASNSARRVHIKILKQCRPRRVFMLVEGSRVRGLGREPSRRIERWSMPGGHRHHLWDLKGYSIGIWKGRFGIPNFVGRKCHFSPTSWTEREFISLASATGAKTTINQGCCCPSGRGPTFHSRETWHAI